LGSGYHYVTWSFALRPATSAAFPGRV
jgi:hypothetical protein